MSRRQRNKIKALLIIIGIGIIGWLIKVLIENPIIGAIILTTVIIIILFVIVIRITNYTEKTTTTHNQLPQQYEQKKIITTINQPTKKTIPAYQPKKLMTKTEINFANAIRKALPEGYRIFPQICLASILQKNTNSKFANELFRIIDFCIFDKEYNPVLLIEINDPSHHEKHRIARDYKVKDLCEIANIPLLKLWTEYGINQDYIDKKIKEQLSA